MAPAGWSCAVSKYDDGSSCDCNCGIADPDCEPGKKAKGCLLGQSCDSTGKCAGDAVDWKCAPSKYADGVSCDCNCGAPDPDCAKATNAVKGCLLNQTCDSGVCVGDGVPWTCSASFYDESKKGTGASVYCDCGCGAPDPDCKVADSKLFGCDADMTCTANGTCSGGAKPLPAGWTCSASKWRDTACDCNCGIYDPSCDKSTTTTPTGCEKGQTCGADAKCAGTPLIPPQTWTCTESSFGAGGTVPTCNCECGAADPDCALPNATVTGCKKGQTCGATGKCEGDEIKPPPEWTCTESSYLSGGTSPTCNCNCGARDPDCENAKSTLSGCKKGQYCDDNGACAGEEIKPPPEWTCSAYKYAEGGNYASCDCNCGAFDPDCKDATIDILGCGKGQTCSDAGACLGEVLAPPKEWTCSAAVWLSGVFCNCNCGSPDPDCKDPDLDVTGCKTGEVCNEAGACVAP
jgi:hypothetical protein